MKLPIPNATYRIQFNQEFKFADALEIIPYLHELGISHIYSSPILAAKPGSHHGYDVVDYHYLNHEIGELNDFEELNKLLAKLEMGIVLDIVPNHMFIGHPSNKWWQDILENGQNSPFADFFDIDWHTSQEDLENKVLLPLLDEEYGQALENKKIKIIFKNGIFYISVNNSLLLTDPKSWISLLELILKDSIELELSKIEELKSIIFNLKNLPIDGEKKHIEERQIEKKLIIKRLSNFFENSQTSSILQKQLTLINGQSGVSESFDWLDNFLRAQSYRLSYWRVANYELNFRRFFDIFEYVGMRMEKEEVFKEAHCFIKELAQKNRISGLRVDHIDGLWDPREYLMRLKKYFESDISYIIVEKILIGKEPLPTEWPIQGTVGYDFTNQLNGLFVFPSFKEKIINIYERFIDNQRSIFDVHYECKKMILNTSLMSEFHHLTSLLLKIAKHNRKSQDFTEGMLKIALEEIISHFPIYRTYIEPLRHFFHPEDEMSFSFAINKSKEKDLVSPSVYDFIHSTCFDHDITEEEKENKETFVRRFQQITGPVMAKGIEDTALYRYYPLASLNEVGSNPNDFGIDLNTFHSRNFEKKEHWPYSMLATTTHDTKRSEDVRARINVLSEIPEEWEKALMRWSKWNESVKPIENGESIDKNDEYLLYQTLIGTWPLEKMNESDYKNFVARIQKYMEKATKEAKIHTSWINPNEFYDKILHTFIEKILEPSEANLFLNDLQAFISKILPFGLLNSLSQLILKLTSPGIPDLFQGNEIWDFSLVDPDNRRKVNYKLRVDLLESIQNSQTNLSLLVKEPKDGRIKLFITKKILQFRKNHPKPFLNGSYTPLNVKGPLAEHVIAFARIFGDEVVLVITTRFFSLFMENFQTTLNKSKKSIWEDTYIEWNDNTSDKPFFSLFSTDRKPLKINGRKIFLSDCFEDIPMAIFFT